MLAVRRVAGITQRLAHEGLPVAAAGAGARGHDAPLFRVQRRWAQLVGTYLLALAPCRRARARLSVSVLLFPLERRRRLQRRRLTRATETVRRGAPAADEADGPTHAGRDGEAAGRRRAGGTGTGAAQAGGGATRDARNGAATYRVRRGRGAGQTCGRRGAARAGESSAAAARAAAGFARPAWLRLATSRSFRLLPSGAGAQWPSPSSDERLPLSTASLLLRSEGVAVVGDEELWR